MSIITKTQKYRQQKNTSQIEKALGKGEGDEAEYMKMSWTEFLSWPMKNDTEAGGSTTLTWFKSQVVHSIILKSMKEDLQR